MMTARELETNFADELGRCEVCGHYVREAELAQVDDYLECPECVDIDYDE
jgi:DNA-directed RNA polymerase subunit RPC12/RpoP